MGRRSSARRLHWFLTNLFVYIDGSKPSLKLLPPCPKPHEEGVENQVPTQQLYDPLANVIKFWDAEALCVLRNEENEYVVGYLCLSREVTIGSGAEEIEAQLYLYYSYDSDWEMHALPIFCQAKDMGALFSWSTTTALAFGTYLCWIDYQHGILFYDMSQECLRVTYRPLPIPDHLAPNDEGLPVMKFVDVKPSRGYVNRLRLDGFEINFWTLVVEPGSMDWKHEFVLRDNELCISKFVPNPQGPLMLPAVSTSDPYVAYFLVCELDYNVQKAWLVSVNLITRSVKFLPYRNGDDGLTDDADMPRRNCQNFAPFLPSEITKFFQQIARDLAAIMEGPDDLPLCLQGDIPVDNIYTSVKKEDLAHPWESSYIFA
ncbi:hypothetical protein C2845_PM04G09270 [Panicum miliaceum]|uniref:DUF1618 domain-containing protein n=1 Tax=Panicum miliaceum TaxID=4540 RepID=A0A3L6QN65_PANMI|nr:hypothetical protein C2845_PM04G09270 [Panicum miliaceum]